MNIDPRLMKQLLQLSAIKPLDLYGDNSSQSSAQTDFAQLLSDLVFMSSASATSDITTDRGIKNTGASAVHPFMLNSVHHVHVASDITSIVNDAASRYRVDPSLVMAVIQTESSFNPYAVSSAGAKGLMQLMDGTAAGLGVADPFDPVQNVNGGVRYLSELLNRYDGNVQTALAAYNAGPGRINSLGISNDHELCAKYDLLPQETQHYINKVLVAYESYR